MSSRTYAEVLRVAEATIRTGEARWKHAETCNCGQCPAQPPLVLDEPARPPARQHVRRALPSWSTAEHANLRGKVWPVEFDDEQRALAERAT